MLKLIAALVASALVLVFVAEVRRASERSYSVAQYHAAEGKRHGSARHAAEEQENGALAYYTYWLTFFTGVLALATIGLGGATLGLYLAGERQLELAKETSDRQATEIQSQIALARDEFLAAHRPQVRIKHVKLESDIWQGEPIIVSLTCLNNGETVALLQELGLKYLVVRNDRDLPLEPDIPAIVNFGNARLPVGRNLPLRNLNANKILTGTENSPIQEGRAKLYCIGWISCLDEANRMRITGFCRVLTFPENVMADVEHARFRTHADPDYEYQD